MTFSSPLEARQFLINKIVKEATRTGIVLSDAERRMLQLKLDEPESATGIPVEVLEDASGTYEKKMFKLLRAAFNRDRQIPQEQQKYREAIRTLRDTDHYILIIATGAIPQKRHLSSYAVYIIIALAVAAMILALQLWTRRG
jgi:ribose 5-phosphate isomerase